MGNYGIIFVLAGIVAVSTLLYSSRKVTTAADIELSQQTYKILAREASLTGLNLTARRLAADTTTWSTNPARYEFTDKPYKYASFTTDVQSNYTTGVVVGGCPADTVDIISTGTAQSVASADSGRVRHVVEATFARVCEADESGLTALAYRGHPTLGANRPNV